MSPSGRVKAALAGAHTSICFVCFTLLDSAEMGRLMTKKAEPTMVATTQAGRTTTMSASMSTPGSCCAKARLVPDMSNAMTHTAVRTLVFMLYYYSNAAPLSNKTRSSNYPKAQLKSTTVKKSRQGRAGLSQPAATWNNRSLFEDSRCAGDSLHSAH